MDTTRSGSGLVSEMQGVSDADLLPVRQRIAWMAAIWLASVAALGLVSCLLAAALT